MDSYYAPLFLVKIEGQTLAADVSRAVMEVSYDNNLETADMFSLRLHNGDLHFTDSPLFDMGNTVEIHIGYAGDLHLVVLGEITAVQPTFPQSGAPTLTVTGYDRSQRMRHNNPGRFTFKAMSDSAIVTQIAIANGLTPVVDLSPLQPQASVQQMVSDWALLKELADRNGFDLYVQGDKLYFRQPQPTIIPLEWGRNLSSFTPRLSTAGQGEKQVVRTYNPAWAQTVVEVRSTLNFDSTPLDSEVTAILERAGNRFQQQLGGLGRRVINKVAVDNFQDAAKIAETAQRQQLTNLFECSGSCIGMPTLRAGDQIEIQGLGKRFSGRYRLSRVTHTIGDGGYTTNFEATQKQRNGGLLASLRAKLQDEPPPNKQEKIYGVVIGRVENNLDPERLGRVQLSLPHLSDQNISNWARVATLMAGNGIGSYFIPDVGDEVLVAFEHGDINRPIVLGSLWNGLQRPATSDATSNAQKTIRTKAGHLVMWDDETQSITISSAGRLVIRAEGDIEMQATNINVKVSGTMDVSGPD
ncbi:MAG: phage baseplate assembly protein V [Caldilineaceae bacterium]